MPGGAKLQVEDAHSDVINQLSQVENFIDQKVDAIIVNPADTAATQSISDKVSKAGIPLVYVNSRPEVDTLPAGMVFVGTDERAIGRMQMEFLAEKWAAGHERHEPLADLGRENRRGGRQQ